MLLGLLGCGAVRGSQHSLQAVFPVVLPLFSVFGELHVRGGSAPWALLTRGGGNCTAVAGGLAAG